MTHQAIPYEQSDVLRPAEMLGTALSDEVTISGRLIERGSQPDYGAKGMVAEDRPAGARRAQCQWLPFVRKQLRAIAALPEGWDSYGAPRPKASLLKGARNLIDSLSQAPELPMPYVNPTRKGGVQFEWEVGDRYFELEVVAERAATYYWRDHSRAEQEEGTVFEGNPLDTVLEYVWRVGAR